MTPSLNNSDDSNSKSLFFIWAIISILLFIAYWPSLQGPMIFDDIQNIVANPQVAIKDLSYESLKQALLSNDSGLLKRVLPALSFGINHYMAGGFTATPPFKLTNLLVHIVNSGLLMCLILLIWPLLKFPGYFSRRQLILSVALITSLWALHPLQVSTVAYVVQRMTSMAATFVLLGLCLFVYGRKILELNFSRGLIFMTIGVIAGTILGLLSKENAALVSCYAAVIEFSLFRRKSLTSKQKWTLNSFYTVFVLLPVCLVLFYYFVAPGNLVASYTGRPFSLSERLWTESRVLWFYLSLIFIPDITHMGLFHDDIVVSHGWLQPISTLVSVITWCVLLIVALLLRNRLPVFTFAVLWYLVGHSMESSFLPLELVYEHRNYLPSLGIIIFIAYILTWFFKFVFNKCENKRIQQYVLITIGGILICGLVYTTWLRANYWASERNIFTSIGQNHPESAISQYLYGEILFVKDNKPLQAYPHYFKAAQLNPGEVAFLMMAVLTTPPEVMNNLQDLQLKKIFSNTHIVDLILHKPLSPWSLTIFDAAAKCALARQRHCLTHTQDIISWLQAVLKSRYVAKRYKRQYIQQLYTIQMLNGQYEETLKTIHKAIASYGRAFPYYMQQADALQALGRYQEALTVLKEAELGVRGHRPDLLRQVQHIQRIVARKYQRQKQHSTE
ncbi:MAG: hypothetical protein DRQ62_08010 [Gammaproteobacteria bacterium]|nr:MAG: hypothetical protein DRQ62_08010 [Gammaproteobacteria bacterium]